MIGIIMVDGEAHRQPFFKFFLAAFTHRFDNSGGVAAQDQVNRWLRVTLFQWLHTN